MELLYILYIEIVRPNFEDTSCVLCGNQFTEGINQQDIQYGYLVTNKYPFNIKLKECLNKESCGASHMLFPYQLGTISFVGQYLKDGIPVTNIISRKLKALLLREDVIRGPKR